MAVHVNVSGTVRVAAPLTEAFRFFTPEGERLYVPGWAPEYLHPEEGTLAEGLTFRTKHGGEDTIWLVSKYEPDYGAIDYLRITPDSRIGIVMVRLASSPGEGEAPGLPLTDVTVTYRLTSLSTAGDRKLAAFEAAFADQIASWERSIAAVLKGS